MTTFFSLPTPAGRAELASAILDGQKVPFTHIAIGDGGGSQVDPTGRTGLVREVDRVPVASVKKHKADPTWLIVEAVVPADRGGYWIRELAVIGGRAGGQVLSVSNYPAVERPTPGTGAVSAIALRMVVAFADAAAVSLFVDPQAYATVQAVRDLIAEHEAMENPHPQYLTQAHETAADPHPQYLTKAEADGLYDANGLAAEAIKQDTARLAAHVQASDPHPQYLNADRAAAGDRNAWAEQYFNAAGM